MKALRFLQGGYFTCVSYDANWLALPVIIFLFEFLVPGTCLSQIAVQRDQEALSILKLVFCNRPLNPGRLRRSFLFAETSTSSVPWLLEPQNLLTRIRPEALTHSRLCASQKKYVVISSLGACTNERRNLAMDWNRRHAGRRSSLVFPTT
jgi:hypothetical protein